MSSQGDLPSVVLHITPKDTRDRLKVNIVNFC
jgi:hypothetical protein